MKFRTTKKALVANVAPSSLKRVGYRCMTSLLHFQDPSSYTCGALGWNFDVYEVYGLTICTGYRNMPGEKLEYIEEYEEKAKELFNKDISKEELKEKIESLLKELCEKNIDLDTKKGASSLS